MMSGVLQSVPWFVMATFAASGVLALVVGRRSEAFGVAGPARVATLVVGLAYAAAAGIVIALWVGQQW